MKRFSLRAVFLGFAMLGLFLTAFQWASSYSEPICIECDHPDCEVFLDGRNLGPSPAHVSRWDLFRVYGVLHSESFTRQSFHFTRFGSYLASRHPRDGHRPLIHVRPRQGTVALAGSLVPSHLGDIVEIRRSYWKGNKLVLETELRAVERPQIPAITRAVPGRDGRVQICLAMPIPMQQLTDRGIEQVRVMTRVGNYADGTIVSRYETIDLADLVCHGTCCCYETNLGGRYDDATTWIDGAVTLPDGAPLPGLASAAQPILLSMVD